MFNGLFEKKLASTENEEVELPSMKDMVASSKEAGDNPEAFKPNPISREDEIEEVLSDPEFPSTEEFGDPQAIPRNVAHEVGGSEGDEVKEFDPKDERVDRGGMDLPDRDETMFNKENKESNV